MDDQMPEHTNSFSILCLKMEPVGWDVVPDVTSWVEAGTKIRGELGVISFSVVDCSCLLDVGNVIDTISITCDLE